MNKIFKTIVALLGGLERVFYLLTPILLVTLCIEVFSINSGINNWLLWTIGISASVFRGIEVGGWLK